MTEILKFFFDKITDPLGLPINALYEYLIIAVISQLAFSCAFRFVGDLYDSELISGRTVGSLLHWIGRVVFYFAFWAITYGAIIVGKWIVENKYIFIGATCAILAVAMLVYAIIANKNRKAME